MLKSIAPIVFLLTTGMSPLASAQEELDGDDEAAIAANESGDETLADDGEDLADDDEGMGDEFVDSEANVEPEEMADTEEATEDFGVAESGVPVGDDGNAFDDPAAAGDLADESAASTETNAASSTEAGADMRETSGQPAAAPVVTPTPAPPAAIRAQISHATDADFDTLVLQSGVPVLVDFWAPWCAPCQMIAPLLDQLADQYDGRARIVRVDIEAQPNLGRRYNARTIPMQIVFKGGQIQATQLGAVGKPQLAQLIDKAL